MSPFYLLPFGVIFLFIINKYSCIIVCLVSVLLYPPSISSYKYVFFPISEQYLIIFAPNSSCTSSCNGRFVEHLQFIRAEDDDTNKTAHKDGSYVSSLFSISLIAKMISLKHKDEVTRVTSCMFDVIFLDMGHEFLIF